MKIVLLTNSDNVALIDDEDLAAVLQFSWMWNWQRKYVYACLPREGRKRQIIFRLHVLLMGAREGLEIDHKDGNPLNNQRDNLRYATHAQNMANRKKHINASSRYKGVSMDRGKWAVYITVNRKVFNMGRYSDEVTAARVYDLVAIKSFGEFARLNFAETINLDLNKTCSATIIKRIEAFGNQHQPAASANSFSRGEKF